MASGLTQAVSHSEQRKTATVKSLPDVVISHIAQFLSPSDLGNMRRVNRYFRQLFSSPHLWKGIKIKMPRFSTQRGKLEIDLKVLETIKLRGIKELDLRSLYHGFDNDIRVMLETLPQLEGLSLALTTIPMFNALFQAASNGHFNVKKLALGNVAQSVRHMFSDLFMQLPRLEEVGFGYEEAKNIFCEHELRMGNGLQRALCCSGKLASVSLTHFAIVERSCLIAIMAMNPHLKALSLDHICELVVKDDVIDPTLCSSLMSLELTSLNVTYCRGLGSSVVFPVLSKLPKLRKLNLRFCPILRNCSLQRFHSLQSLEWLELGGNRRFNGEQLFELSKLVGKTLHYLGLAYTHVTESDLRNLARMFPVLKTLDLSRCEVTDAILVEWYTKHDNRNWPKLRKLVLKGCQHISRRVVDSVRLKTRNQLVVDM